LRHDLVAKKPDRAFMVTSAEGGSPIMKPIATRLRLLWLVLALVLSGCGDYRVPLPNGYELVRVYAGAILIADPTKALVVNADIDGYTVLADLIVGHVAPADHPPERDMSVPGYFIVNTRTREVRMGLEKPAWLDALLALGVRDEPRLGTPSRFDKHD
jgi:hypothetical protein